MNNATTTAGDLAPGRILSAMEAHVAFAPTQTNYELHLAGDAAACSAVGQGRVRGIIRAQARKVWTMASGGAFIAPIVGTPRVVQGRVKRLSERELVLSAGADLHITLPKEDSAFDLANGPIRVGSLVNATLMPGASLELA